MLGCDRGAVEPGLQGVIAEFEKHGLRLHDRAILVGKAEVLGIEIAASIGQLSRDVCGDSAGACSGSFGL